MNKESKSSLSLYLKDSIHQWIKKIPAEQEFHTPLLGTTGVLWRGEQDVGLMSHAIHLLGFCYDGSTSFRPGSRFAPNAIRDASIGMETYSSYACLDLEDYLILDVGNLPFSPSRLENSFNYFREWTGDLRMKEDGIKFLTLGGEHSISYAPIELYLKNFPDLVIIHLDAHTDLRDGYLGDPYSHAAVIRRVVEKMKGTQSLFQYGIRSGLKEEFLWMEKEGTLSRSFESFIEKISKIPEDRAVYLTLDLDFFDPSFLPGTGTPEPGGESFPHFMKIVKELRKKNLVGADVVELSPPLDLSGNSNFFASIIVREILLSLI